MTKQTEEIDEQIKNFLYRLHFPCKKKRCKCDKLIKDAQIYLKKIRMDY